MNGSIIIVTKKFPYGNDTGEVYLRSELPILAKKFEQVVIIACDGFKSESPTMTNLPKNTIVIPLMYSKLSCNRLCDSIAGILALFKQLPEEVKEEWDSIKSFKKKFLLTYFIGKVNRRIDALNSALSKQKISNVICVYSYRFFVAAYISLKIKSLLSLNNSICITRAHGYDLYENRNVFDYLPMRKYLLEHLDAVYPCSMDGTEYLKDLFPDYASKCECIYLGSDDADIKKADKCSNKSFSVISCSTITPVKRVEEIACLINLVSSQIPICWTHIGDGNKMHRIKRKYKQLIMNRSIILLGRKTHNEVKQIYCNNYYDLFINLSVSEGLPQAIMEAISFGIPVVATDAGGNREIVHNGENGFLVPINYNIKELAKLVEDFYIRADKENFRSKAREIWENYFRIEVNAAQFVDRIIKLYYTKKQSIC